MYYTDIYTFYGIVTLCIQQKCTKEGYKKIKRKTKRAEKKKEYAQFLTTSDTLRYFFFLIKNEISSSQQSKGSTYAIT